MSLEFLTHEALKLSRMDRIELARLMLESITTEEKNSNSESEILKAQIAEVKRRVEYYHAGKVQAVAAQEVHQKLSKKYGL